MEDKTQWGGWLGGGGGQLVRFAYSASCFDSEVYISLCSIDRSVINVTYTVCVA